jgi:hypothetical protein
VELPLGSNRDACHGKLLLIKDLSREPIHPFTLRRVEHIRRSVTNALKRINRDINRDRNLFSPARK